MCANPDTHNLAVYVHVPFCARRCPYCDFPTIAGFDDLIEPYFDALRSEISASGFSERPVASVYFGGGTPSYVNTSHIGRTLTLIRRQLSFTEDVEVTAEANPSSSDAERFVAFRQAGINRLSIGVQSFDDDVLSELGRLHAAEDARRAIVSARTAGYANIGVDLIFGSPRQTLDGFVRDLRIAVEVEVEHISTYALTVETGTPLNAMVRAGRVRLPDEDTVAQMYEAAIDLLEHAGYEHYEVSNFAKPGRRSRHNMAYWTDVEYIGFGAGAASYVHGERRVNVRSPQEYIQRLRAGASAVAESETLTRAQMLRERILLGLRLREGLDEASIAGIVEAAGEESLQRAVARHIKMGNVERSARRLRLTRQGLLIADSVIADLIPD